MNTEHEFHLMQLADSLFPSGIFSMSSGLEPWVRLHGLKTGEEILKFIKQQIQFQLIPCDCVVLYHAIDAIREKKLDELIEIDKKYYSMKLVNEVRKAQIRSGSQVLECASFMTTENYKNKFLTEFQQRIKQKIAFGTYPTCLAVVSECLEIPKKSAIKLLLYTFCSGVVGAGIRLGIIQHFEGQKILTNLSSYINEISNQIAQKSIDDIWQLSPYTEILQMMHEKEESTMFIT